MKMTNVAQQLIADWVNIQPGEILRISQQLLLLLLLLGSVGAPRTDTCGAHCGEWAQQSVGRAVGRRRGGVLQRRRVAVETNPPFRVWKWRSLGRIRTATRRRRRRRLAALPGHPLPAGRRGGAANDVKSVVSSAGYERYCRSRARHGAQLVERDSVGARNVRQCAARVSVSSAHWVGHGLDPSVDWIGLECVGWLWPRCLISNRCSTVDAVSFKLWLMND